MADPLQLKLVPNKKDFARVDRLMESVSPKANRSIWKRGMTRVTTLVQSQVQGHTIRRRGTAPPSRGPHFLTNRTGGAGIVGSIATDLSNLPRSASVGTDKPYGRVHEEGGTFTIPAHSRRKKSGGRANVRSHRATFPRRAYLQPGVDQTLKQFAPIMIEVIEAEMRKAL